jgi:hypothetical protein
MIANPTESNRARTDNIIMDHTYTLKNFR